MNDLTRPEVDAKVAAVEAKVEARVANFETTVKTGFAEMRVEMHKNTADIIKWVVGVAIAIVGLTVGLLSYIVRASDSHPSMQPPAPPPIIITVPSVPAPQKQQ